MKQKRRLSCAFALTLCLFPALLLPARAVIVDRIAIVAGGKIITDSQIVRRVRLAAFQNGEQPDLGPASRQRAAQQLIDQRLVESEMDLGRYPPLDAAHRKALLDNYMKKNYHSDAAAMNKALAAYMLKPQDLEEDLGHQADLLTFLNLRFRPAVQVTDEDVEKYYDKIKGADKSGGPSSRERAAIERKLTAERADKELDLWLQDQRKRTKIEYLEKDLEPAAGGKP